jgi:hypothetical protein
MMVGFDHHAYRYHVRRPGEVSDPCQRSFWRRVPARARLHLQRFSLGCRAYIAWKCLPAKENYRLIPYICSGTAIVRYHIMRGQENERCGIVNLLSGFCSMGAIVPLISSAVMCAGTSGMPRATAMPKNGSVVSTGRSVRGAPYSLLVRLVQTSGQWLGCVLAHPSWYSSPVAL